MLNKVPIRNSYPLSKIFDLIKLLDGFTFASSLDLNVGYYTLSLDPGSLKLCLIVLPWGHYAYQQLATGMPLAPNLFQEKMNDQMTGLQFFTHLLRQGCLH